MALDSLYVSIHAHWFADFFSELLSFPAGKYDDQVDALSLIGQMQTRITRGRAPEPKAKLKVLTVGDPDTQEAISLDDLWRSTTAAAYRRERV